MEFPMALIDQIEKFGGGSTKGANAYGLTLHLKASGLECLEMKSCHLER
jgi:hypothetical protein